MYNVIYIVILILILGLTFHPYSAEVVIFRQTFLSLISKLVGGILKNIFGQRICWKRNIFEPNSYFRNEGNPSRKVNAICAKASWSLWNVNP